MSTSFAATMEQGESNMPQGSPSTGPFSGSPPIGLLQGVPHVRPHHLYL
jgi:hypothetical protein